MVPAVAWNVAAVPPAPTVTEPGTVNAMLLSARLTTVPPLGAGNDSVTVQVVDPPEAIVLGLHCSDETVGKTVIVPPVPVMLASVPLGSAPKILLNGRESSVLLLEGDRIAVTTATVPLLMAVGCEPVATQVILPDPAAQVRVSPMEVSAEPAIMLTEETAVEG